MEQYERSGPKVDPKIRQDLTSASEINELKTRVELQDRRIDELERDLRKLRNDMRMAIATANTINANNRRHG